jgi:predicted O-linked N-acetylglucosamine transferase (SPINDLY family)
LPLAGPFSLLGYTDDPALHLRCARNRIGPGARSWTGLPWRHDKIKIAYLSADFRRHPVSCLLVELIERHDRARFEVIGVSFLADDRSVIRKRLVAAFDQFYDVWQYSDDEIAQLLYDLQIDIALDLTGHTQNARLGIFARHPAPIQVNLNPGVVRTYV